MGFDLSGVNPKMNVKQEEFPVYDKYEQMDWSKRWDVLDENEKEREKYWEESNKFQTANPGIYFRNNVWWWRPLWQFVCEQFPNLISDEDAERGCYNDGHEIPEDKAMRIGVELTAMIEDGSIQEYSDGYQKMIKALPQVDCRVCDNNNYGNSKKRDCKACNQTGLVDDWAKSYPFDVENVREFATFCLESGGFTIC